MNLSTPISRQQADHLLRWLKELRALGGAIAILDLQRYLHQCLRAQVLKDYGFKARVRGQWQNWLLVVEGGKNAPTRPRARTSASRRRLHVIRNRGSLRTVFKGKPHPQHDTPEPQQLHPWFLD